MLDTLNPFRKNLFAQIMAAFSLLSFVTVGLVSYSAYHRARATLEKTMYEQLTSSVSLKEYQLLEWLKTQQREATTLARSPLVIDAINALNLEEEDNFSVIDAEGNSSVINGPVAHSPVSSSVDAADGTTAQTTIARLQNYLKLVTEIQDNLYTIDIVTPDGTILLSNQSARRGQGIDLNNTTYFTERTSEPKNSQPIIPNIYINAGVPTITFATPIIDETGRSLNILLATTPKAETINQIIRQRAGLGESGEAYLVKTIDERNLFLAGTPIVTGFSSEETRSSINSEKAKLSSQGIDQALQGEEGKGLYLNYQNKPVVGVYRWLDQYEVALLAELSQAEAFQPAIILARQMFAVGIVTIGILLLLVYALVRHIVHPILLFSRAAQAVEANRFQPELLQSLGNRPDELGHLARNFIRMAKRVTARQTRLKAKIQKDNERISKLFIDRTSANIKPNTKINAGRQQASELELAYYDALKRKATWLRQQSVATRSQGSNQDSLGGLT